MKKAIILLTALGILVMFNPSCKSAGFEWNPVGNWTCVIVGSWGHTWSETLTLTGDASGGMINGWEFWTTGNPGTWEKAGDCSISMVFDFPHTDYRDHLEFTCNSSEASPNTMSGSGTWYYYYMGVLDDTFSMTITGTKTSNLQ